MKISYKFSLCTTNITRYVILSAFLFITSGVWAQTNRYWVGNGGDSNWGTAANWSTESGGTENPAVPAATDTVIFDANSFTADGQTVTLGAARTCVNMIWENLTFRPVFDMQTFGLTINGSLELHPNVSITAGATGTITFGGPGTGKTITTSNVNIPRPVTFNNNSAGWIVQDSLKMTNGVTNYNLTLTNGDLNLNGNYLRCGAFNGGNAATIYLNIANSTIDANTWSYTGTLLPQLTATATEGSLIRIATTFSGRAATDFYNVIEAGNGVLNGAGGATFKKIIPFSSLTNGARLQNVVTDTLILDIAGTYWITGNSTVTVNEYFGNIRDLEDCSEIVTLQANTGIATVNMAAGATFDINNIIFGSINITGPDVPYYIEKSSASLGVSTGFTSPRLYWVGGAGNWNDPNQWSTESGGVPGCFIPGSTTTVVFDDESGFTSGDGVTLNVSGTCDSMLWEGSTLAIFRVNTGLTISGSLILQPNMIITGTSTITFNSTRSEESITTNNITLTCAMAFNNATGKWILNDSLTTSSNITLTNGNLISEGNYLSCATFTFTNGNLDLSGQYLNCTTFIGTAANARQLNIANATIDVTDWTYTGNTVAPVATNSTIRVITGFTGNPVDNYSTVEAGAGTMQGGSFQKIIMNKDRGILNSATTTNDVVTDTLILGMGNICYIYQGSLVTINDYLSNTRDLGNCDEKITLASTADTTAYIEMINAGSEVNLANVNISYIDITGPGMDYYVSNSYDLGGNSGWIFEFTLNGRLYWVGGTGNWSDGNHWSDRSGGTPICAVPTTATTVVFDDNSGFIDESTGVAIDIPASCDSMIWIGTTSTPTLTRTQALNLFGSLELQPNMLVSGAGVITFRSTRLEGEIIKTNGVTIGNSLTFNSAPGTWRLGDNSTFSETLTFSNGNLDLNGNIFTIGTFTSTAGTRTLNIANSTINVTTWNYSGANGVLIADNSLIRMTTGSFTGKSGDNYGVLETPTGTVAFGNFRKIVVNRGTVTFNSAVNQNIYTDTLLFAPGSTTVRIFTSTTATSFINVNNYLGKTHSNQLAMTSTNTAAATINMGTSSTVKMDTLILSRITINGPEVTGPNGGYITYGSVDRGNNTNWIFEDPWVYDNLANTYYWRGGLRDGIFNNIANWELGFPGSGITPGIPFTMNDDLVFPPDPSNPTSMTLNVNGSNTSLKNLYFNAGSAVTISNTATIMTVNGNIIVGEGNRLSFSLNRLDIDGDIIIKEFGSLTFSNAVRNIIAKNIKALSNTQLTVNSATNTTQSFTVTDTILIETGSRLSNASGTGGSANTTFNAKYFILNGDARLDNVSFFINSDMIVNNKSSLNINNTAPNSMTFSVGNLYLSGTFRYYMSPGANSGRTTTINQNLYIYAGGLWDISLGWIYNRTVNLMGNTYVDGRIQVRTVTTNDTRLTLVAHGNFNVTGRALFNGSNPYFRGDLIITGDAQFINAHTYLESTNPYILTLGTPTITSFTDGTFRFNSPAAFIMTEDLIMPSTGLYITTNNNSFSSNSHRIKSNLFDIANSSTARIGRMLDFSNSLLEVKNFTVNGTRTGEHNFNTTTVSFWDTTNHNFNVNLFNDAANVIGKVTFSEIAPRMTFATAANGVKIDTLETGDISILLNYTNTNANYAITANVWDIKNPCDIYATHNPIINVRELIVAPPVPCEGVSQLRSLNGLIQLNNISPTDPIELRYLYCRNVNFGGSFDPAFVSPSNYDLGGNTGSISWEGTPDPDPAGEDFYWIGGNGDWFDGNNWSFDEFPPKTPADCIPTMFDNAIFDEYSFTGATQNVTINTVASIHHITWIDPNKRGGIILNANFEIHGSSDFTGCRYAYGADDIRVVFAGKDDETITSGGLVYNFDIVNFSHTGTYTLTDDFIVSQRIMNNVSGVYHYSGGLISNGHNITAANFNSTSSPATAKRYLNLAGSTIKLVGHNTGENFFIIRNIPSNNTIHATTWTLNINNLDSCKFAGSQIIAFDVQTNGLAGQSVQYYDVEVHRNLYHQNLNPQLNVSYNNIHSMALRGDGAFQFGFTTKNLFLKAYNTYTFNYSANGPNTYIITDVFTTDAIPCLCNSDTVRTTIQGNNATASRIQVGDGTSNFEILRAVVSRINCTPGDEMIVIDGVMGANGNISNVTLVPRTPIPAIDFYWVGGSGNWSDYTHWSVNESGGNPLLNNLNECIPSQYDSVIFDRNSFPADFPRVILDINGFCKSMTWTSDMNAYQPNFGYETGGTQRNLSVYGSLELSPRLVRFAPRQLLFRGSSQDKGVQFIHYHGTGALMSRNVYFSGGGRYDILSAPTSTVTSSEDATTQGTTFVQNGSSLYLHDNIRFQAFTIAANSSFYSHGNSITINSGTSASSTIAAGTMPRTIDFSGSRITMPGGSNYSWVFDDFTTVDISNATISISGSASISLTFANSTTWDATNSNIISGTQISLNNPTSQNFTFHNIRMTSSTAANATLTSNAATTGTFNFNKVEFTGSNTRIMGPGIFIFDTLMYARSSNNLIAGSKTLNVNKDFIASGTPCANIQLSSTDATPAVINSVNCNPISVNFAKITNVHADISGACTSSDYVVYGDPSIQIGADGWTLYDLSVGENTLLGPDITLTCPDFPYTQTSEGFGVGDTYTWYYRPTAIVAWTTLPDKTPTLNIDRPGFYSLRVDYGQGCYLGGPADVVRHFIFDIDLPPAVITSSSTTNALSCIAPEITLTVNEVEDPASTLYNYQWKDPQGDNWLTDQIVVVDEVGYFTVVVTNPINHCVDSAKVLIRTYDPDDLLDCYLMDDKVVYESSPGLGYYEHSGTSWDPILTPCVSIVDSIYHINIAGTAYSGNTLDGFRFPIGTTTVMWAVKGINSEATFVFDTCYFDVTVKHYAIVDCSFSIDRTATEDGYLAGYYTHADTTWNLVPYNIAIVFDSVSYFIDDILVSSGATGTLVGAKFLVGVSNVLAVAYYSVDSDTCEFTVTVFRACPVTVDDIHGNTYDVIALPAGVCWTTNMRATHYSDGTPIEFARAYTPTNHTDHDSIFGLLYTWYSVVNVAAPIPTALHLRSSTHIQGICPDGWHIPSQAEWALLNAYDAQHLRSTDHWLIPGTNNTGFNSLPAGRYNSVINRFVDLYGFTGYWASDDTGTQNGHAFILNYYCDTPESFEILKSDGLSVRCLMD